jgi:phosphoenolpyruvate-protein kinase (PTS system EI component)
VGERTLRGVAASPGLAHGAAHRLETTAAPGGQPLAATAALEAVARELEALARRLSEEGRRTEAEIVETNALIARDPALIAAARREEEGGRSGPEAVREAAERLAASIAALDNPSLALRADDVRSVGRRAARIAGGASRAAPSGPRVLIGEDLGPADVAELDAAVSGVALGQGGVTAHAAIVARSLGVPMVVGLGRAVAEIGEGTPLVLDGDAGVVVVDPGAQRLERARAAVRERGEARRRSLEERSLPSVTRDGHRVPVLANVASPAEVEAALATGAEGVGLLRTELAFLDAAVWPSEADHERFLRPILEALGGRTAIVRLLDFGGDKTPPFAAGWPERGVELLLAHPGALAAQLRAVARVAEGRAVRVLVPMVTEADQLRSVRRLLDRRLPVGAMVEVPAAATMADRVAAASDFLSLGTNDLASLELGQVRWRGGQAPAHHPAVLRRIAQTVAAARAAGVPVEVCGEAASDPRTVPLLVGLGVGELSVGAARVGVVRRWIRALSYEEARGAAERALELDSATQVADLVRPLLPE